MEHLVKRLDEHEHKDDDRFEKFNLVIFGDEKIGEMGMKKKVDVMYDILVQAKGVKGFFGGLRGGLTLLLAIAAVIAWAKGWLK